MKKGLFSLLMCSLLIALSSCEKSDALPADSSQAGGIVANKVVVGTNQQVLFACPIVVSKEATNISISWETADGITVEQDSYDNGISYKTLSWSDAGSYTIKCKATYIYGSDVKQIEKSHTVTVTKSHYRNSFIGDSYESVVANNPGGEGDFEYIIKETDKIKHLFSFSSGVLTTGVTTEIKVNQGVSSPKAAYSFFMMELSKHKNDIDIVAYGAPIIFDQEPLTEQETAVRAKFIAGETLSDDERVTLGLLIERGQIYGLGVYGTLKNDPTIELKLSIELGDVKDTYVLRTNIGELY